MLKRIMYFLFGCKLPYGHVRRRAKPGTNATCPVCNRHYFMVKFIGKEPRRIGTMIFRSDLKDA